MEMCVATARVMGEFPDKDDLGMLEESIHALINARLALFYCSATLTLAHWV